MLPLFSLLINILVLRNSALVRFHKGRNLLCQPLALLRLRQHGQLSGFSITSTIETIPMALNGRVVYPIIQICPIEFLPLRQLWWVLPHVLLDIRLTLHRACVILLLTRALVKW